MSRGPGLSGVLATQEFGSVFIFAEVTYFRFRKESTSKTELITQKPVRFKICPPGPMPYILLRDERSLGVNAGAKFANMWHYSDLNTPPTSL